MATSPAQGQEDVPAPARPAVGRGSLDDFRLIRGDRMPSLGTATEAGPRPARAARRRRHAAVPGPDVVRRGQPDRPGGVRPALRRGPQRAAGAPGHGVLPRGADAPPGTHLPGRRGCPSRPEPVPPGNAVGRQPHRRRDRDRHPDPGQPGSTRSPATVEPANQPLLTPAGRFGTGFPVRQPPTAARDLLRGHRSMTRPGTPSTSGSRGQRTPGSGGPAFAIRGARRFDQACYQGQTEPRSWARTRLNCRP